MLTQLRQFIANNPNAWKKITRDPAFKRTFQLGGESLKRMPRGFDEGHELAIDLKRKDFALFCELTEAQATGSRFLGLVCSRYEKAADFMDYLCAALDVEFH